jgi:hypothetical protein
MKRLAGVAAVLGVLLAFAGETSAWQRQLQSTPQVVALNASGDVGTRPHPSYTPAPRRVSAEALNDIVKRYCQRCHSDALKRGNLTLASFDVGAATNSPDIAEKVIAKLRSGMMPPPGERRPRGDTLDALTFTLENQLDSAAAANPNPGHRTFQRMNRAEYTAAVRDILGLDIDAGAYLPPDTKSENFDNIADVQTLSPTLLDSYLRAASDISWLVVGNPSATASSATFSVPRTASQMDHVEGTPFGSRGGTSVVHTFPADGDYLFKVFFYHETTGAFAGGNARNEQIEISIDGERVAVLDIDRFMSASDPNGVSMATNLVRITAGPHRVAAAFIPPAFQGVQQDLISPLKWSLNSTSIATAYGFTLLPHLRDLVVTGPFKPTGVSDTPVRRRLFSCRPTTPSQARSCAESIVNRVGTQAYRRPLTAGDTKALMAFYDQGAGKAGSLSGFESGVRTALEAILASPDFVFRFERAPATAKNGAYRISDVDLASRLAFFLWSAPPDHELLSLAAQNKLSEQNTLARQVRRMLADPRAEALATRFASQWLRLPDLDKVQPDVRQYPDFDEQLRTAMRRETELFFENLVREDRSVLELFTSDYTFVNERLAEHYGIPNVAGPHFRRVQQIDPRRRGLLAHASLLTLTSHATRTSPVERGKWVMEVFLNSPPPPPPPGVPDFEATPGAKEGRQLTVRERMEEHRSNPTCNSCHKMMDPIGLALENYDVTGRWRVRDNGMPIDSQGELWDGTKVDNPADLNAALLKRRESLLRTFTRNLMAYGLGRRVEYFDLPTIRGIVRTAAANDNKMSSYVMGIVNSPAFRMQKVETAAAEK